MIRTSLSTRTKLFLSHFLAIVLVSGSIGSYFYNSAIDNLMGSLQARLKYSAALLQSALDPAELDAIRSAPDLTSAPYQKNVALLREFESTNPDIAFIYVMRRNGEMVSFVVDSDRLKPASPGDVYEQTNPELMAGFGRPSVDADLTEDDWGTFLSGYAPVKGGRGEYLIGIDMRADEVQEKLTTLRVSGAWSLASSVLLALLFSHLLSRNFLKRISALHQRCLAVSHSAREAFWRGGDELDQLTVAFDDMMEKVQQGRNELEDRVDRRTRELQEANANLHREAMERARIAKMLEETSHTDFLTGLINRRAMAKGLQHEIARVERLGETFSLVLVDIDHFKVVNDQFGHEVGDEVLKALSRAFESLVREQDMVARWGGEEFLVLLPGAKADDAAEQAERLRRFLDSDSFQVDGYPSRVTASFGVCEFRAGQSVDSLLKQADVALYQAKASGRNRVVTASRVAPEAT